MSADGKLSEKENSSGLETSLKRTLYLRVR